MILLVKYLLIIRISENIGALGLQHLSSCLRHELQKLRRVLLGAEGEGVGIEGLSDDIIVDSRSVVHDYRIFQPQNRTELVKGLDSASRRNGKASAHCRKALNSGSVGVGYLLF